MSLRFHTVSDLDIKDIQEMPFRLDILHYGELLDPSVLEDLDVEEKTKLIHWTPKAKSETFYVEGFFQSLHYLLTAETGNEHGEFPLNFLVGHGIDIGEIGWGKATFYPSGDVLRIKLSLPPVIKAPSDIPQGDPSAPLGMTSWFHCH